MAAFKIANAGVTVVRDEKTVRIAAGKPFDFTKEELKSLEAAGVSFRDPKNEADGLESSIKDDSASNTNADDDGNLEEGDEEQKLKVAVAKKLLADKDNLTAKGDIDLSKLNATLVEQGFAEVKAAERKSLQEAAQAEIDAGNEDEGDGI